MIKYPTEAEEAKTLVQYLRIKGYTFHHSPNETGHTPEMQRRAIRVKREGTSRGFPDYLIIKGDTLIAIELKRVKGSITSPEQLQWLKDLAACGVQSAICHGASEAIEFIESIKIKEPVETGPIF